MKRLNRLVTGPEYKAYLSQIERAEQTRIFCGHDIQHFLDVSRLLYIYCLEEGLDIDRELIYAIGFLHDIGRAVQYTDGTDHHRASADIARALMPRYGFEESETALVISAVESHRTTDSTDRLCSLTYKADKKSRRCYDCKAIAECNWSSDKLNREIEI